MNLNLGRRLFQSKVMKGVKPLLLMPETNALSERLYSKLKRIKTYHKSNLNHNRSTSIGKFYTTWIFFLSGFSFTNIHDSEDSRRRERLSF